MASDAPYRPLVYAAGGVNDNDTPIVLTRTNGISRVVAPASLLANWTAEIERFAPGLTAMVVHPSAMPADQLKQLTPEHFDETLKTNLYGYFHLAQAAVPHMRPGSAIINTGSVTGITGSKELVDYSMTKGGIHAFTRALSGNLLPRGIRVNCVAPGPVWTPLNPSDKEPEDVSQFGARTPMKRPAQPEEIAPAYVFLASPQCSSYITGEIVPIVGGY